MNDQPLLIGLIIPYFLGGILILAIVIKLFTTKPPTYKMATIYLIIGLLLIALPIATKITVDIEGIKIVIDTATSQVTDLNQTISELQNENEELTVKIGELANQINILSDPNSTRNEKNQAAAGLSSDINNITSRLSGVSYTLDSAQVKSNNVMENLIKLKNRKTIIRDR